MAISSLVVIINSTKKQRHLKLWAYLVAVVLQPLSISFEFNATVLDRFVVRVLPGLDIEMFLLFFTEL